MPKQTLEPGITSVILRFVIIDRLTGLEITTYDHTTSGLVISAIGNNEQDYITYSVAAGNLETITTLGTYAAPSANKARFRHVGLGMYEVQLANPRFAVSGARAVQITIGGGAGMARVWAEIQQLAVPAKLTDASADGLGIIQSQTVITGTVGAASTTTVVNLSAISPTLTVNNQLAGRVLLFRNDTTTAALRGQGSAIASGTTSALTLSSALTVAPSSGDTFTIV